MTPLIYGRWFYCSFADERGFLGAIVVEATSIHDATSKANILGINPGGEVIGRPVRSERVPPEEFVNRLLAAADVDRLEAWGRRFVMAATLTEAAKLGED